MVDNDDKSDKIEGNRSKYMKLVAILIDTVVYLEVRGRSWVFEVHSFMIACHAQSQSFQVKPGITS